MRTNGGNGIIVVLFLWGIGFILIGINELKKGSKGFKVNFYFIIGSEICFFGIIIFILIIFSEFTPIVFFIIIGPILWMITIGYFAYNDWKIEKSGE